MRGRVLMVAPVFTHPPIQGNAARILAFGRQLKQRGFEVDLMHFKLDGGTGETASAMRTEWSRVVQIEAVPHARMAYPAHWGLDDWCPESVVETVGDLVRASDYDAVVVNYVWMSRVFEGFDGPLKILDTHDVFGDRHRLSREADIDPNWFFTSIAEEDRGFDRADVVIAIQETEARQIAARTRARTIAVAHPVPPVLLTRADSDHKAAMFGYIGSANPWNEKSLLDFDAAVLRKGPVDWAVAGTICRSGLSLASARYSFGVVDDPREFYRHVACCFNPMASGTGLKIKTVEAMAHGRAIIGTQVAFEGLDPRHDFHRAGTVDEVVDAAHAFAASEASRASVIEESRRLYLIYMDGVRRQYEQLADDIEKAAA